MLTNHLSFIEQFLKKQCNRIVRIEKVLPVSGGCINEAYLLKTDKESFFCKVNEAATYPNMFGKEAKGLLEMTETNTVKIPKVIGVTENMGDAFLFLEYIEPGDKSEKGFENLGEQLAKLHQVTNEYFGLDYDNYIGSLEQNNSKEVVWSTFYAEHRLNFQLKKVIDSGAMNNSIIKNFERLYKDLNEIFPEEPASLLHGDLWSGNFMIDSEEKGVLIDPAVYYGHREMDLGMTRLFGGFSNGFYDAYQNVYPLEKDWENRIPITQLYPLLVHVNLFGGGYVNDVARIVSRF